MVIKYGMLKFPAGIKGGKRNPGKRKIPGRIPITHKYSPFSSAAEASYSRKVTVKSLSSELFTGS
jgi:hypothetical protein